jgi:hypothetical protein
MLGQVFSSPSTVSEVQRRPGIGNRDLKRSMPGCRMICYDAEFDGCDANSVFLARMDPKCMGDLGGTRSDRA